jgi:hypothetical protein
MSNACKDSYLVDYTMLDGQRLTLAPTPAFAVAGVPPTREEMEETHRRRAETGARYAEALSQTKSPKEAEALLDAQRKQQVVSENVQERAREVMRQYLLDDPRVENSQVEGLLEDRDAIQELVSLDSLSAMDRLDRITVRKAYKLVCCIPVKPKKPRHANVAESATLRPASLIRPTPQPSSSPSSPLVAAAPLSA